MPSYGRIIIAVILIAIITVSAVLIYNFENQPSKQSKGINPLANSVNTTSNTPNTNASSPKTPTITISYNQTQISRLWMGYVPESTSLGGGFCYYYADYAQTGYVWDIVNMTIRNDGYSSFSTSYSYFNALANNTSYGVFVLCMASPLISWGNISLPDGGTFSGNLVFHIPIGTSISNLTYNGTTSSLQDYNLIVISNS